MTIAISARFDCSTGSPTDLLLQFEAADLPEQRVIDCTTSLDPPLEHARVAAHDDIGTRIWMTVEGPLAVSYTARVEVTRQVLDLASLDALAPHDLPSEAVDYLFDSRYCPADRFQPFVESTFEGTSGGARIAAIRDYIAREIAYERGSSTSTTDAADSFIERRGICRDFAHLVITFARASTIPARYVACYAPGVEPPDFHAVAEVFLCDPETPGGGTWQIVDATGMADPAKTVKIGVGRDAADVSFLTSFGPSDFGSSAVAAREE